MSPLSALAMVPAGLTLGLQGAWALPLAGPAAAMGAGIDPSQLCRAAIAATERTTRIPDQFLSAIGRVESGRMGGGRLNPWPWTVNAAGAGHFYPTKQAAEEAVRQFEASGVKSLDVGCLQVNLFYHPNAFPSLDQAFDPASNAAFAAGMLLDLFQAKGSWPRAAAAYHSMTPALGEAYRQKVLQAWSTPDRPASVDAPPPQDAMLDLTAFGGAPRAGQPGRTPSGPAPASAPGYRPDSPSLFGAASPAPSFGFSRRFMLAQGQPGALPAGRSLANYRAVPVRFALRPPMSPASLAR